MARAVTFLNMFVVLSS